MLLRSLLLVFLISGTSVVGQYAVKDIPKELSEGVNAVIRDQETIISLPDYDNMTVYKKEVVTVFNKNGLVAVRPFVFYDNSSSVKELKVVLYDKNGKEIETYKKRDFADVSATGSNLYTDDRKMYLEFPVASYPFTVSFISEVRTSSTAFVPQWDPSPYYDVSTQKSVYTLNNENNVPLVTRKYNLERFNVVAQETSQKYRYELLNMPAVARETLGPHYSEFTPVVKIALQKFQLENEKAYVKNWKEFGIWQKEKLLQGRDKLSKGTRVRIAQLVHGVEDPKEKTRLIYEYMQGKTRYISVQVGIGGWQPSPADEVDELSYGDCKGLTNYTMALLKSQNIESYYTIVDSGYDGRDIDEDFVAVQGDHVILTVPFEDENVFLECTDQQMPFNYLGYHTDDRKVLMVTPTGGVIGRTHSYKTEDNLQSLTATATIGRDLKINGKVSQTSGGIPYASKYMLETGTNDDVIAYYKRLWSHLNNLSLANISFDNDKTNVVFTEGLYFETENYTSTAGDRILLNPNIFNRYDNIPLTEDNRTLPLKIRRGESYKDVIEILIPEGYVVEAAFEPIILTSKFGSYTAKIDRQDVSRMVYERELLLNPGTFPKEVYDDYVDFIQKIVKKDKSKIVLVKG